jgi:trigger factor
MGEGRVLSGWGLGVGGGHKLVLPNPKLVNLPEPSAGPFRLPGLVKTVVEPLEGNKVKLSVEVEAGEFEAALEAAFRRISREVRVPGFRPGKVPRRVLEARLGKDAARQEALREALPDYYAQAVRDQDVDAIAPPEIDITSDGAEGPLAFDAVVEVRPTVAIPGYEGLQVTIPALEVEESDVDAQVERLRDTFAELREVDRPARDTDHVTIDISGSRQGDRQDDLSTEDFLYEVGSGRVVPELDDHLRGAKVGDIVTFEAAEVDGESASFRVLVKDVKEKVLPDVSDEWASEASEFETVEELRHDIRQRLQTVRRVQARMAFREAALEALTELVGEDPPDALVNSEMERRLHDLGHRLEAQGANIAQYLQAIGRGEDEFVAEMREGALQAVKADLALRALAEAEAIEATDEDAEAEVASLAERYGVTPTELARQLDAAEQMAVLRMDVRKGKALTWLIDHVSVVDQEGREIDRSLLEDPPELEDAPEGSSVESDSGESDGTEPVREELTTEVAP